MAQAAQATSGGGDLGFQQFADARADGEVAATDDALGDAAWTVAARGAHRGDAGDELDFAQCGHLARAVLAIHRAAFQEDGRDDVVPAADVGQQFRQQVTAAMRRVPEMVVRIDDRQIRLQRRLGGALRQPRLQRSVFAIDATAVFAFRLSELGHGGLLRWFIASRLSPGTAISSSARGGSEPPARVARS